jgi:hypothetical protein
MPKRSPRDSVVFVAGARGSGKSSWLKQYARGFGRVLVWDPMHEYGEALGVAPVDSLTALVAAHRTAPVLVFAPDRPELVSAKSFDLFCQIAWARGAGLVLVDELATVTTIGKAPGWWGRLIREGRHRRIEIAAAAQRPAEIDKTIIGNCTRLVVFRLGRLKDRQLMAEEIDIERADIDELEPLEFISADRLKRTIDYSRIVFA